MSDAAGPRDPSARADRLRDQLNPLLAEDRGARLPGLASVPTDLIAEIAAVGPFADEVETAFRDLGPGAHALLLDQYERLAGEVRGDGGHHNHHSPLNIARGLFPIRMASSVVACLDTGPLKIGSFTDDEIRRVARAADAPRPAAQRRLAALPVLTARQVGRVQKLYRTLAAGFEARLGGGAGTGGPETAASGSDPLIGPLSRHYHKLLSVILGYGSLLASRDDLREEDADSLGHILSAAAEGKQLSELLFDEDWETSGPAEPDVHTAIETLLPLIAAHRSGSVEFARELRAAERTVRCPRHDLHQLVFEILTVALDLAPPRSRVTLRTEACRSPVPGDERPGFALRLHDAAGAPFDEAAAHLTLGLSAFGPVDDADLETRLAGLVRRVRTLGGTFKVQPHPGRMTSLELVLPTIEPRAASAPVPDTPFSSHTWAVDDDPVFGAICADMLAAEGHRVTEFRSIEATQRRWQDAERPDLVLLDYTLDDGDARDFVTWLDTAGGGDIPVVVVTSLASDHPGVNSLLDRPNTHFLAKPLERRELADTVNVALGLTLVGS